MAMPSADMLTSTMTGVPVATVLSSLSKETPSLSAWPLSEIRRRPTAKPPLRWACESAAISTTLLSLSTVSPSPSGVRIIFTVPTFELPSESDPLGLGSCGLLLSPPVFDLIHI